MKYQKEVILNEYPNPITYECIKEIKKQMKYNVCKIKVGKEQGTGFFCKIPFPDKNNMLPVFITNNHIINKKLLYKDNSWIELDIKNETNTKKIELNNRMKYTNEVYDITIVEIKEKDKIKNYLELDDIIFNDILYDKNYNKDYKDKTIYIMHYPKGELSVSFGLLQDIYEDEKFNFNHKCCTEGGSSGSPILRLNNYYNYNKGTFLNFPIKEFINLNYKMNRNEEPLKRFNKKYDLNIKDTKIDILDLGGKRLGNEMLEELCKIEFKELKKLFLFDNNI